MHDDRDRDRDRDRCDKDEDGEVLNLCENKLRLVLNIVIVCISASVIVSDSF